MNYLVTLVIASCFLASVSAAEFYPENLIQLDAKFSHHVIVVEKSTHKLYLYTNKDGLPHLTKTYDIATGKIKGNKFEQGDHKTPEGIYIFQEFHSDKELIQKYGKYAEIYGAGAFTTNYPNLVDRRAGKTGGGIWLHSTDDDSRVSKGLDSRGCVVAVDADLKDISKYIDLTNTPVVIVQNLNFQNSQTWNENKEELTTLVSSWSQAWQNKDFDTYIKSYSPNFYNSHKGNYKQYAQYKKAVFSRPDKPTINFSNVSILKFNNYAIATLEQDYTSDIIQDIGKKVLYLERDKDYEWKIIAEEWHKLNEETRNLAFTPSHRFFNTTTPSEDSGRQIQGQMQGN